MFDILGTIYKSTGVMLTDNDGHEYPETAPIAGYHVNTLPEFMTEALQPFAVTPSTPRRVFAGREDTVFLTFADEAEFKQVTGYVDSDESDPEAV
jgi:hypothetical protein